MIDALLWVGGVAVGSTFGFSLGRRRLELDDQRVAETIANLRQDIVDRDIQISAQRHIRDNSRREHQSLWDRIVLAEQRQEHPDTGKHGRYTTAKGVELRVAVLAVAVHNQTDYAIIVPTDLAGATPYMIRLDAVTIDEAPQ
jgi:hypothetical protein